MHGGLGASNWNMTLDKRASMSVVFMSVGGFKG